MNRTQRGSIFFAVCVASFAGSSAHASTRRDDVADANYLALGNQFTSVGAVIIGSSFGSATLIGNNWILTAAHVNSAPTGTFFLNGNSYTINSVTSHPLWAGNSAYDFALGFISSGVGGETPMGYYAGTGELGMVGTSVGFGMTGTGITGQDTADGLKRGFNNVIDALNIDPQLPGLIADFDSPAGNTNTLGAFGSSPTALGLEGNAGNGDSGGGLFANFFGNQLLVGVTSYVAQANFNSGSIGKYGDATAWADLTIGTDWIQQTTGIAPVNPVPEPATMAALGLGALALLRRKRVR